MKIIEITILRKLVYMNKWGASHTSFDNLPKGFPSHLGKQVKNAEKELIKKNLLLSKPTVYGLEVSLNPEKSQEIKLILSNSKAL